ncbi:unnamed protein product, partial [Mesorhabditis spiculigera]
MWCIFWWLLYPLSFLLLFYLLRRQWERLVVDDLPHRPVLITGCDSGFGYGLAVKCVANGMPVFAGCRTEEGIRRLQREIGGGERGRGLLSAFLLDVTNGDSVEKAVEYVAKNAEKHGGLYGIVNNAGIVGHSFYDDFLTIDDYRETLEVNLFGVVRVTKAFVPQLRKTKGRIVNMASMCARLGLPGIGPYTVSKHGVSAYSDCIRQELRIWGISVHVIEPGFFKTPLISEEALDQQMHKVWDGCREDVKQAYGREFFDRASEVTKEMIGLVASGDVQWVIDTYFHALTAKFPRRRYQVGWDHILFFLPLSILPAGLSDGVLRIMEYFSGAPVPRDVILGQR